MQTLRIQKMAGGRGRGGPQPKSKLYATLWAVVARVNSPRSVEIRLLNHEGWHPCGHVTIPAHHQIPKVGQVIEVRYRYADRESKALAQPIYAGPQDDVDVSECVLSQLKYPPTGKN